MRLKNIEHVWRKLMYFINDLVLNEPEKRHTEPLLRKCFAFKAENF